jgi:hypothetical protein
VNVEIQIRYSSPAGVVLQRGYFPLKGRKPEEAAVMWWREIRRESFADEIVEVIIDGEDVTEKVKEALLREE